MKAKNFGKKKIILILVLAAVCLLFLAYMGVGLFFGKHFQYNTRINGVDCSRKTIPEVEQLIQDEISTYQLQLTGREESQELIRGKDIGLKPVFDGSLEKELAASNGFAWPLSLFHKTEIELETMVEYEEGLLDQVIDGLECVKPGVMKPPKDAYISSYIEGKGYEIVPEEEGTRVDKELVKEALHKALINLREQMSLEEEKCYMEPKIRSDNEKLTATLEKLNKYVSTKVTYDLGQDTDVLDGDIIQDWITLEDNGKITIDQEKIAKYVDSLAEKYDTAKKARSFTTSYGSTINIGWNEYGWKIDQEQEEAAILENVKSGEQISRELMYSQRARSHGNSDHGGTYVEINLTAQHLYFYKDGNLVVESDLVSGNLAKGNGTPGGAFPLAYKQRDAVLRGEDYRTPVSYWMPFNGGIGLHDATWRSDFGGNYYKSSGSHGCINLPYSVAEKIYNNIEAGDAIFVYELAGTESAKGIAQDAAGSVIGLIGAIGEVTLESEGAIQSARTAYDGLNDMAKGYVNNYDSLVNAEAVFAGLVAQQQAQAQAQSEAQPVIDAIAGIGEVTLEREAAIVDARQRYNALSEGAKPYVTNLNVLVEAENKLDKLKKEQAEEAEKAEKAEKE